MCVWGGGRSLNSVTSLGPMKIEDNLPGTGFDWFPGTSFGGVDTCGGLTRSGESKRFVVLPIACNGPENVNSETRSTSLLRTAPSSSVK